MQQTTIAYCREYYKYTKHLEHQHNSTVSVSHMPELSTGTGSTSSVAESKSMGKQRNISDTPYRNLLLLLGLEPSDR